MPVASSLSLALLALSCGNKEPTSTGPAPADPGSVIQALGPAAAELSGEEILILHTNDLHGHYLPERAAWIEGEPEIGGFALLDAWVDAIEDMHGEDRVLLLDGGDVLTGTPLTDIEVRGSQGGAMLDFMEAVGYDAWAIGNHEFDKGFDNVEAFVSSSKIPALSANVHGVDGGPAFTGQKESIVLEAGGYKIGVIGATTEGLTYLVSPDTFERLSLEPVAEAVAREVERLEPETDLIVVLSHIGLDADKALAAEVEGIDLIVGGHSHTHLDESEKVGDTWVVQAGSYCRTLGVSRLTIRDDRIVEFNGALLDLLPELAPGTPSRDVERMADDYRQSIDARYGQLIGESTATLSRAYSEENLLGAWITDALVAETGADFAVYNTGGLRSDLVEGPLTLRSIYEIFPFGNQVVMFELTGAEITGILLGNAFVQMSGEGGMIQFSGAELVWRKRMEVPEVLSATIAGTDIEPFETYTVATNSYVLQQAARYLGRIDPQNTRGIDKTVFDVAVAAVERGPVQAPELGRIREAGTAPE